MEEIVLKGGARYGLFNASWPFAKLVISQNNLKLKIPIFGELNFSGEHINSIEKHNGLFSKGIIIKHNRAEYRKKVVFWTFESPSEILKKSKEIGGFNVNL